MKTLIEPAIRFDSKPQYKDIEQSINMSNIFGYSNNIEKEYIVFEFTNLYQQLMNWLMDFKKSKWEDVESDMRFQAQRIGFIKSVNGERIRNSEFIIEHYFDQSAKDVLTNAMLSIVDRYEPIAVYDEGAVYSVSNFKDITAETIKKKFETATPRIKNLLCSYEYLKKQLTIKVNNDEI